MALKVTLREHSLANVLSPVALRERFLTNVLSPVALRERSLVNVPSRMLSSDCMRVLAPPHSRAYAPIAFSRVAAAVEH